MKEKPRLCFVGSMLGRNAGHITTQGQITADLFAAEGYETTCVSSKINRFARLVDIAAALIKNRRRFDLVLLEVYSGLSLIIADLTSLLCRFFKLPLVMVLHGGNLPEFLEKYPRWTKRVLRRADRLVAPSRFLASRIGAHGFEIQIVANVVELDLYAFRERREIRPNLLWMRSFHPIYNPQMAVEALDRLRADYPEATLTMAGVDKGLEPEIKKMVADRGLAAAVRFPGFLDAAQKAREFSRADVYLNTNRADNMPVSVVEACAFGVPVVATNVGGLPYLIADGDNGLLVENENAGEMAAAIKKLLENPDLTQKISNGGRTLAEQSGWSAVRAAWEKLFAVVLDGRSGDSGLGYAAANLNIKKQKS